MGQSGGGKPMGPEFNGWIVIAVIAIILGAMTGSVLKLGGWTIFLMFVYAIGIRFAISIYDQHHQQKNK